MIKRAFIIDYPCKSSLTSFLGFKSRSVVGDCSLFSFGLPGAFRRKPHTSLILSFIHRKDFVIL